MMQFPVTLRTPSAAWTASIRPQLLAAVNRLPLSFTVDELAAAMHSQRLRDLARFLDSLVSDGRLTRDGAVYSRPTATLPVPPDSLAARKQQQMWNILRGGQARPSIDVPTLAVLASTAQVAIGKAEAGRYVVALVEGRYLRERSEGRFYLPPERNVGPLAPRLMQVTFLVDPNQWTIGRHLVAQEARL